jgi:hypothetical protein
LRENLTELVCKLKLILVYCADYKRKRTVFLVYSGKTFTLSYLSSTEGANVIINNTNTKQFISSHNFFTTLLRLVNKLKLQNDSNVRDSKKFSSR